MKTNNIIPVVLLLAMTFAFTACDKDDPIIPNEEELITTVSYSLTPSDGGDVIVMSFVDLDGDGGNDPVISGGILGANQTYEGSLQLLNEAETPSENITEEIEEEDEDHQFFFQSSLDGLSVSYADQDSEGNPVGLNSTLTTGESGSGMLTIILRHKPVKSASGVSDGDITNAQGDTDIQVTFPVDVQ